MIDDLIALIKNLNENTPVIIKAAFLAFALRILRLAYAEKEKRWLRRLIEGSICSLLVIGIGHTLVAFGINELAAYGVAAYAGHYGADKTAETAKRKIEEKIGHKED